MYICHMIENNSNNVPKVVMDHVGTIINGLTDSGFFDDYDIGKEYAHKLFNELIMERYVNDPSLDIEYFWNEEEFNLILNKVVVGSMLHQLKEDGVVESYEDENTEETFFLTDKGNKLIKKDNNEQ